MIFRNRDRLKWIARNVGSLQLVFGGKAHPQDQGGKELIRTFAEHASAVEDAIKVVYLEDFDWRWAPLLYCGVDLWLNTPKRPQEASETSGMKDALNGVPSLSIMDGWWVEGCLEGTTGWPIADRPGTSDDEAFEAGSLYHKLKRTILPMFYRNPEDYGRVMCGAIAVNGSFLMRSEWVHSILPMRGFAKKARGLRQAT